MSARSRVLIACGVDRYDVRGSYWWFLVRWRWALKRNAFMRCVCGDGKVRWFNARQIVCAVELPARPGGSGAGQ